MHKAPSRLPPISSLPICKLTPGTLVGDGEAPLPSSVGEPSSGQGAQPKLLPFPSSSSAPLLFSSHSPPGCTLCSLRSCSHHAWPHRAFASSEPSQHECGNFTDFCQSRISYKDRLIEQEGKGQHNSKA